MRDRQKEGQKVYCSESFDPLGEAKGDLSDVGRLGIFRALVWDESNDAGQSFIHLAGANRGSVKLYVQPGSGSGIVKSSSPGGVCNEIASSAGFIPLDPVAATGNSWFNNETAAAPVPTSCDAKNAPSPPVLLCTDNASDLRRVIQHAIADFNEPVVYANDVKASTIECTGTDWEFAAYDSVTEGWVCLAAEATDRVGNHAVSAPIRLCYDDADTVFEPPCKTDKSNPPSCVDNCTLPKRFISQVIDR